MALAQLKDLPYWENRDVQKLDTARLAAESALFLAYGEQTYWPYGEYGSIMTKLMTGGWPTGKPVSYMDDGTVIDMKRLYVEWFLLAVVASPVIFLCAKPRPDSGS